MSEHGPFRRLRRVAEEVPLAAAPVVAPALEPAAAPVAAPAPEPGPVEDEAPLLPSARWPAPAGRLRQKTTVVQVTAAGGAAFGWANHGQYLTRDGRV